MARKLDYMMENGLKDLASIRQESMESRIKRKRVIKCWKEQKTRVPDRYRDVFYSLVIKTEYPQQTEQRTTPTFPPTSIARARFLQHYVWTTHVTLVPATHYSVRLLTDFMHLIVAAGAQGAGTEPIY